MQIFGGVFSSVLSPFLAFVHGIADVAFSFFLSIWNTITSGAKNTGSWLWKHTLGGL